MQNSICDRIKNVRCAAGRHAAARHATARPVAAAFAALAIFCAVAYAAEPPPPPPKVTPLKPVRPVQQQRPGAAARGAGATNPGAGRITTANPGGRVTTANPGGRVTTVNPRTGRQQQALRGNQQVTAGSGPVPSKTFNRPGPAGSTESRGPNGSVLRRRADGSLQDFHEQRRGLEIQHGLNGDRVIVVNRPDHSRVFVERGKDGYVQQRYMFGHREFGHRSYYVNGRLYDRFYRRYPMRGGGFYEVYAPVRYYPVGFYAWAYSPWRPAPYAWGWAGSPWYGHYGYYFTPYPVYAGAPYWLTDYLIATSLQAAYVAAPASPGPVVGGPPALTPEVKQKIAEEVRRQVEQETAEAQANQQRPGVEPATGGIVPLLSDNRPHVFVAGSDLDLVDPSGRECMLSQGDVVQVVGVPPGAAGSANAVVLASKGGTECAAAASVEIALTALQEMQNHMRETVDQGMAELQAKQGQGGLPPAPAGATGAPVPAAFSVDAPQADSNAANEISQQVQTADQAEQGTADTGTRDIPAAPAQDESGTAAPAQISLGQSIETVTSILGAPTRIIDLGAKKIYAYPDMKVIFTNGQVSDVQ